MSRRQTFVPIVERGLVGWAALGLFVLLAGLALISDGSRYATQLNLLLFLPGLLLVPFAVSRLRLSEVSVGWVAFFALLTWVLLSVWLNPGEEIKVLRWLKVCTQLLVFVLVMSALVQRPDLLKRTLFVAVAVAMGCAWLSLYQNYWVLGYSWAYRAFRLEASGIGQLADFGNPILAALYYGAMTVIALGLWQWIEGRYARLIWFFGILGMCLAVFLTYSRGVWVALGLAVLCFWGLSLPRRYFLVLAGTLMSGLIAASLVAPLLMAEVFLNLSHREEIWLYALEQLGSSSWLAGLGPDTPFNACVTVLNRCFNQAHNLYLQVLFEFGVLGLLLLIGLLMSALYGVRRLRADPWVRLAVPLLGFALIAGVASYHSAFSRPGLIWIVLWLPVGILLGLSGRRDCIDDRTSPR